MYPKQPSIKNACHGFSVHERKFDSYTRCHSGYHDRMRLSRDSQLVMAACLLWLIINISATISAAGSGQRSGELSLTSEGLFSPWIPLGTVQSPLSRQLVTVSFNTAYFLLQLPKGHIGKKHQNPNSIDIHR